MAKVVTKSGLAGKLGTTGKKAVQSHREDETRFDVGGRLPAGIENGVAQLVDCRFGQYEKGDNKGEYFFYAAGVITAPEAHNGVPIKGLRTSIIEPMHDTPGRKRATVDDHVEWVLNEMRKLGADTKNVEIEDLETLAAALKEEGPHFRFRTWKGEATKQFPNPRVNEVWNGLVDFDGEVTSAVEDNTEDTEGETGAAEEADLASLGNAADDDSDEAAQSEAQVQLSEMCEAQGVDPDQYETWAEVAAVLSEGSTEGEQEAEGEVQPAIGEVWYYKPPKAKKKVEVDITAVFEGKKTVNCKNLEDNKTTYRSVPWDQLSYCP
jgi:hypothetical protein